MSVTTSITCPKCRTTLKLPAAIPAGLRPKCPRCGTLIVVAAVPVALPVSPGPGFNGVMAEPPPKPRSFSPLVALGIILGAGVLLLGLTAALLFVCLQGDVGLKSEVTPVAVDDDVPVYSPAPPPRAPVSGRAALPAKIAPATKALIDLTPEDIQKVDIATQRGVAFLRSKQIRTGPDAGCWRDPRHATVGFTSLCGLTLLECNVKATDPAVQSAADFIRRTVPQTISTNETYQVSISILFLARLDDKADYQLVRSLALRLVASQHANGGWLYNSNPLTEDVEVKLLAYLRSFSKSSITQNPREYVGVGDKYDGPDMGDNSNTQFALLALWAARRYDLPLDPVLRLVAQRFRNSQMSDGSWAYQNGRNVTPSEFPTMTAAGLLGLAVGYGLDHDGKNGSALGKDDVLQKGLQRLAQGVGNPGEVHAKSPYMEMYFLWSVERVAVLYHLAKIDGKDWYHWGLDILTASQQSDGKWHLSRIHAPSDIVDTCFALLFLQRANLAKDLTDKIQQLVEAMGQLQRKE
jgi:hypothetical protein